MKKEKINAAIEKATQEKENFERELKEKTLTKLERDFQAQNAKKNEHLEKIK